MEVTSAISSCTLKDWDILSPSHFQNSCMKSRFLESGLGGSHLELCGHGHFLKDRAPKDWGQTGQKESELLTTSQSTAV